MNLMRSGLLYALPVVITLMLGMYGTGFAQDSKAPARSEAADKTDFETVCGACHTPGMVSDIRTEADWKDTVEQMVSLGAEGTADQMAAVMRVLLRSWTRVNVNTATATQLPLVLDISEATAKAVIKYRSEHGNFKTLADLKKVPGVDAAKLDARKDRIAF
jgi:competence protein ComEA